MNVLIVDDDASALGLLKNQLMRLDCHNVSVCDRAQDAMALMWPDGAGVDLVFCDLQMPEVDGVEFVRYLGRIGYRGHLVLISAEDPRVLQTVERLALAHDIPVLAAVEKPVPLMSLQQLLNRHAERLTMLERPARARYSADELRAALLDDELIIHVQPKVRLSDGELVGVEALVRWRHPRDGLVYPDQFVATAEQHGLIDTLTRRVLTLSLQANAAWHRAGALIGMAVNVSMENLAALTFPDDVMTLLRDAGVPSTQLTLEVTESRLMPDALKALDILTRLRLKRIRLAIDDFGTGYSSLAQLRDVPFDELKLDRSFVHGAVHRPDLGAIVGNTLAMARELGLGSVAEGVETRADWDHVRSLGCDVAQGYFIARPMAPADLASWRAEWKCRREEERLC